ncbi:MAG: DUF2267 domain-containing protein [Verrucomicrobiota bacterium]
MNDPVTANINASMQKTSEWLASVGDELHDDNRQAAYHALRSVMHTLRDRLTPEEASHLAAGLPAFLRGIYYEGWSPSNKPEKLDRQQFLDCVQASYSGPGALDPLRCTKAVFAVLQDRIGSGEIGDVRSILPRGIEELWPHPNPFAEQ